MLKAFSKRLVLCLLVLLLLYLSLYTWNLKTGVLDRFVDATGLEFTGALIKPGRWVHETFGDAWKRYVVLLDVKEQNQQLRETVARMAVDMAQLREDSARAHRLERLLDYAPPPEWRRSGARVIAHEFGPAGVLDTVMIDRGSASGVEAGDPVVTPEGVVGGVLRLGKDVSTVLVLTDPGSRIAVRGEKSRVTGILTGQGRGEPLLLRYVPLYDPIEVGELLITAGLANMFPAGVPAARVTRVERSETSLFKDVHAEPLVSVRSLEDVLVLDRVSGPELPEERKDEPPAPPAGKGAPGKAKPAREG